MAFKRKIKTFFLLIIIVLFFILVIFCLKKSIKYIDKVFAHSQTKIATWSVNLNKINVQKLGIINNDDNSTIKVNTIAPGTNGEFNINIDFSNTEVGIKYKVLFKNETKKPQNLKFMFEEKIYDSLKKLEKALEGIIYLNEQIKQKNFNIKWFWNYETGDSKDEIKQNDIKDTEDVKSIYEYCFDVEIEAHQLGKEEI